MVASEKLVGNYRLFHLIRAGSVYEIWTVRSISENTPYAMKWLPPGNKYTRQTVADLKHEHAVGLGIDHPSIIKTYSFNTTSNGAYLLLELYKVPNLKQHINADYRKLHPLAKEIIVNAAAGLTGLHESGWIHRDVKPDNFLLGEDASIKLIDFNLSRKKMGALAKLFRAKTRVQGTYSYMSPEQIRGQVIDVRSDVYGLGCVIHEIISGKPPFTANSPAELLQRHLRTKPRPLTVTDKNVKPEFATYVQRLMAKDPNDRPASMKDVQMEIRGQKLFYNSPQVLDNNSDEEGED
jgi:serine/threonine protein kinase